MKHIDFVSDYDDQSICQRLNQPLIDASVPGIVSDPRPVNQIHELEHLCRDPTALSFCSLKSHDMERPSYFTINDYFSCTADKNHYVLLHDIDPLLWLVV